MDPGAVGGAIDNEVILDFPHNDLRRPGPGRKTSSEATQSARGPSNGLTKC